MKGVFIRNRRYITKSHNTRTFNNTYKDVINKNVVTNEDNLESKKGQKQQEGLPKGNVLKIRAGKYSVRPKYSRDCKTDFFKGSVVT